ncbi:MAG: S49 family peptidase [Burkholderiaceae bacterium]
MSDFLNDPPGGESIHRPTESRAPQSAGSASGGQRWEQSVLEKMALGLVKEQRAARRWGIFFKLVFLAYLLGATAFAISWYAKDAVMPEGDVTNKHTALVSIKGVIDAEGDNSAAIVNRSLRAAFKDKSTAGVVLKINSPGGSPVQSGLIYREIKKLREEYPDIRLIAVVEEVCASGGYYVAAAADEIHVDQASMIGSIGVLINGFGFTGTMQKLGVERRLFTAGSNKGFLDPFAPVAPEQRDHVQTLLADIHTQFIDSVKEGRGDKLKASDEVFSGLVWTGAQSIELGLADKLGSVSLVAEGEFNAEKVVNFSRKKSLAERFAKRLGVHFGEAFAAGFGASLSGTQWR